MSSRNHFGVKLLRNIVGFFDDHQRLKEERLKTSTRTIVRNWELPRITKHRSTSVCTVTESGIIGFVLFRSLGPEMLGK